MKSRLVLDFVAKHDITIPFTCKKFREKVLLGHWTRRDKIRCPECREEIAKDVFLSHRTERGCNKLDPKLALATWDLDQSPPRISVGEVT